MPSLISLTVRKRGPGSVALLSLVRRRAGPLPCSLLLLLSFFQLSYAGGAPDKEGGVVSDRFEWRTSSPESQGMSGPRLEAMRRELADRGTKALLIVRNDRIVCEWYAPGHGPRC